MTSCDKFYAISKCRVCGNEELETVLDLGNQYLSGIFPKELDRGMYRGPLKLVKCKDGCGHVQLEHTFDLPTMYGEEYGYRSGLNGSMINHLRGKADAILADTDLTAGDIVIDIAGNDGTFLGFFPQHLQLTAIDPTAAKFCSYYKPNVNYIPDFFSANVYKQRFGNQKAKVVTSFSMFYDLEDPCGFAKQVREIIDDNGIWVLEQSYLPEMMATNSFDTVCHEHLSYYSMKQLKYIMDESGFKIVDFEFNDVNGGSVSVVVAPYTSGREECTTKLTAVLAREAEGEDWETFVGNIQKNKDEFYALLKSLKEQGLKIAGLGASTKGNVTLQTWEVGPDDIEVIGDVNPDKDGSYTPGTWIPIKNEQDIIDEYDVFVVLPWHFKKFFVGSPKFEGKKLLFPLPTPEIVSL